jgi:hypothetical protein
MTDTPRPACSTCGNPIGFIHVGPGDPLDHVAAYPRADTLRGAYSEAAEWIAAVQQRYGLGPESSPDDLFDAARAAREPLDVERLRQAMATRLHGTITPGMAREVATEYAALASGSAPLPGDPDVRMTGDDY